MYIVVVEDERGALISEHALFEGELTLGRTTENDVVLPSGAVSRRHARLYIQGTAAYIADLGSSNGILVDDVRIRQSIQVTESSQIRIGEFRVFLERATGRMQAPQGGINTAIVHPEQAHGKLVVTGGPQAGREHLLFEPIICIGRTDENDVTLADVSVSRHHARLKKQDDGSYIVTDLSSSNGTAVRGKQISPTGRARHGNRITFGSVECVLVNPAGKGRSGRPNQHILLFGLALVGAAALGVLVALIMS